MSVRKCEHDQSQAKYVCTTHSAYFCELHYRQHLSDRKPHVTIPIENALTQPEFEQLQNEVIKRIKALEHAKKQVASQAAQLIAKIRQRCIARIEKLDLMIQSYRAYMAENNFDQQALQNITKMLTTRLQIQIDKDLALNLREEPEEEKKSVLKQPMKEAEPKRTPPKEIEEVKKSLLKQPIKEAEAKRTPPKEIEEVKKSALKQPISEPKTEHSKERETRNEPQAKQIPSIK
jgi:hypothetical protein